MGAQGYFTLIYTLKFFSYGSLLYISLNAHHGKKNVSKKRWKKCIQTFIITKESNERIALTRREFSKSIWSSTLFPTNMVYTKSNEIKYCKCNSKKSYQK